MGFFYLMGSPINSGSIIIYLLISTVCEGMARVAEYWYLFIYHVYTSLCTSIKDQRVPLDSYAW